MRTALLAAALAFLLTGCDRRLYFPERVNLPLLQEAGEAVVTGSLKVQANSHNKADGRSANNVTPAVDIAVSPLNHIGLMGSYRWQNNRQVAEQRFNSGSLRNNYGGTYNGQRWEAGAGYYTHLTPGLFFETYAGCGQGTTRRHGESDPVFDFDATYRLLFLQAEFCFVDPDRTKLALGARLDRIHVTDVTGPDPGIRSQIAYSAGGTYIDITERPGWTLNPFVGAELPTWYLPMSVQVGLPVQVFGPTPGPAVGFYVSVGVGFRYFKGIGQTIR